MSYFLFGPRGTGKSTWLGLTYPDALWIDLLEPEVGRAYAARPERLRRLLEGRPQTQRVVIDEIQKAPAPLEVVHLLMERDRTLRFVLTGSSARKLRRAGVDLLAGRNGARVDVVPTRKLRTALGRTSCQRARPERRPGGRRANAQSRNGARAGVVPARRAGTALGPTFREPAGQERRPG